ncbi:gamma carbonic anhydrase family protein [Sporolituus thermophilus]|uniref:Carbonic anhydrase or acetyltransferase, isoleucine patch superfamily n=1 Tax=Sporolituus thermophilus DSM 23256 TaxID=1123285 RepID=A0A1G7JNC7_9FIRM|nr:gamma carbonic anhydrase family protein [Sporolituus thermophilus]SDF26355.1 Carbonic anhydrase or acetyltransferase, isoleucine patch superfamily [Sporolituus thermophilus DSM 23256]
MPEGILPFKNIFPKIEPSVLIAKGAQVIGDVAIGANASIWYNSILRGDVNFIRIGAYTNIQDNSTLHVMNGHPCVVGNYVTVGHNVILHGCTIADNCLIGMGAIILNGVEIGENCIIGAGTLLTEFKKIPPKSLVVGSPGKVVRSVADEEIQFIRQSAIHYHELSLHHER